MALFAARRTSGIVVNVGFNQTSVVPSMSFFSELAACDVLDIYMKYKYQFIVKHLNNVVIDWAFCCFCGG